MGIIFYLWNKSAMQTFVTVLDLLLYHCVIVLLFQCDNVWIPKKGLLNHLSQSLKVFLMVLVCQCKCEGHGAVGVTLVTKPSSKLCKLCTSQSVVLCTLKPFRQVGRTLCYSHHIDSQINKSKACERKVHWRVKCNFHTGSASKYVSFKIRPSLDVEKLTKTSETFVHLSCRRLGEGGNAKYESRFRQPWICI